MIVNRYDNADCLGRVAVEKYDYVYLGPPDYEDADNISKELGSAGVDTQHPETYQHNFLARLLPLFKPRLGTITVSFTADRRNSSRILPKNFYLMNVMFGLGYYLRSAKYALKSSKVNLYSSNIIHVLTFQHERMNGKFNLKKSRLYSTFGPDLWGPFKKEMLIDGEVVGQPIQIAQRCIEAFTDPNDVVYDPFAGIGTTLYAAKMMGRGYIGTEIREPIWRFGKARYSL
tara:strand:- start:388 stop:1077 length:690 start_codon:yes stop_codon:yes gene_type:complete